MAATPAYDLAIYGATAEGIVMAARVADEGLRVLLIGQSRATLGGVLPSLGAIETHYLGARTPFLDGFRAEIEAHYRKRYGEGSPEYATCTALEAGNPMMTFEPHVAQAVLARALGRRRRIACLWGWWPEAAETAGRAVGAVTFRSHHGPRRHRIAAAIFADCSYEGDLTAVAGVACRIGREGRAEHGEPHAGRLFTRWIRGRFPRDAAEGRLNILPKSTTGDLLPGSDGAGDDAIQEYSLRLCLTDDPANRIALTAPPAGYDAGRYAPLALPPEEKLRHRLPFHARFLIQSLEQMAAGDHVFHGHALPRRKRSWNATNFTGAGQGWPNAGWAERRRIYAAHRDHALGLMWFLQTDPRVPAPVRAAAAPWGLAADEFTATGHLPPLYVREARRIVGRTTMTEHDCLPAGLGPRPPTTPEAVAITEFPVDSLACTSARADDVASLCDGQFFEMAASRPGQIPWGAVLPEGLDNLIVPVCCSTTHAAWGTVRQTPTLMHLAEAAGIGAALARRAGVAPGTLDGTTISRAVAERRLLVTFFNDMDAASDHPAAVAMQIVGTLGLIPGFDARPDAPLSQAEREEWKRVAGRPLDDSTRWAAANELAGIARCRISY